MKKQSPALKQAPKQASKQVPGKAATRRAASSKQADSSKPARRDSKSATRRAASSKPLGRKPVSGQSVPVPSENSPKSVRQGLIVDKAASSKQTGSLTPPRRLIGKSARKRRSRYINLCQDLMFKSFFSKNKRLLLSLLNVFLPLPKGVSVVSLKFLRLRKLPVASRQSLSLESGFIPSDFLDERGIVLDLRARLSTGPSVNIEMQSLNHKQFLERILYYWAKLYTEDFKRGQSWKELPQAFSLVFADFKIWPKEKELIHSFSVRRDKPPHFSLTRHLRMVFVELGKFQRKDLKNLIDLEDLWCYLLKESGNMGPEEKEVLAMKSADMKAATDHLEFMSQDEYLRFEEEAREKFRLDHNTIMAEKWEAGLEKGLLRGRKEGRAEGREEGMEKGLLKGREAAMEETALKLLKQKADLSFVSGITGFSKKKLQVLLRRRTGGKKPSHNQ